VDWEPTTVSTSDDARNYAMFLSDFAGFLASNGGYLVTADVATWTNFWNYTDLSLYAFPNLHKVITMSTYTDSITAFTKALNKAVTSFDPVTQLGVGLASLNLTDNSPFTDFDLLERFTMIKQSGVLEVDIWDMPINFTQWRPFLQDFLNN
jgi:hypothetical protein